MQLLAATSFNNVSLRHEESTITVSTRPMIAKIETRDSMAGIAL